MIRDAFVMHISSRPASGIEKLITPGDRVLLVECNGRLVCGFYGTVRELSRYWQRILFACRVGKTAELNR